MSPTWSNNKVRELITVSAAYLIAEYHCGHLQNNLLGKLCTNVSTKFTLQNNFGTGFVE
jgi:hypothetical protein